MNAIDYAFKRDSIFCIKAFVDSLLILSDKGESQFRNCFDKALLLMISRGMDVKELVNSQLLYPSIWTQYSLYSTNPNPVSIPYNGDVEDLEFEDPNILLNRHNQDQNFDIKSASADEKQLMKEQKAFYEGQGKQ